MNLRGIHHVEILVGDVPRAFVCYLEARRSPQIEKPLHSLASDGTDVPTPRHFAMPIDTAIPARAEQAARRIPIRKSTRIPAADRLCIREPDGHRLELIEWKIPCPMVPATS